MYTNKTSRLSLPQWIGTDKPNWNIDLNEAFRIIDENAVQTAENISSAVGDISSVEASVESMQGEVTSVKNLVNSQGERLTTVEGEYASQQSNLTKVNKDVSDMQTKVSTMDTVVDSMQSSVNLLETNYGSMQTQVDGNTSDITILNNATTNINNTKIPDLQKQITKINGFMPFGLGKQIDACLEFPIRSNAPSSDNIKIELPIRQSDWDNVTYDSIRKNFVAVGSDLLKILRTSALENYANEISGLLFNHKFVSPSAASSSGNYIPYSGVLLTIIGVIIDLLKKGGTSTNTTLYTSSVYMTAPCSIDVFLSDLAISFTSSSVATITGKAYGKYQTDGLDAGGYIGFLYSTIYCNRDSWIN